MKVKYGSITVPYLNTSSLIMHSYTTQSTIPKQKKHAKSKDTINAGKDAFTENKLALT